MPVSTDGADYPHAAQLLVDASTYFSAMVVVKNLLPVYTRQYSETVMVGTNAVAFANIGDGQNYIDSFTIECWGAGAYREVKEGIALESSAGQFVLENLTSAILRRETSTSFASTRPTCRGYIRGVTAPFRSSVQTLRTSKYTGTRLTNAHA